MSSSPSEQPWTIRRLIQWGSEWLGKHDIENPRLDVELLLADALALTRMDLFLDMDRPLIQEELGAFKSRIKRRSQREPVAYIVGVRGFWKQDFHVNSSVLIPRPETETLIDSVLSLYSQRDTKLNILDIGIGSGAILFSLLNEFPNASGDGVDISKDALEVAAKNRDKFSLKERVSLFAGDLTSPLSTNTKYDLIVSNPPYIVTQELDNLQAEVKDKEPRLALDGGGDGLAIYRPLIPQGYKLLKKSGRLIVEIGFDQGKSVSDLFSQVGFKEVSVVKDYGQRDRVVIGLKQ
ncbi:MAG: peptide chain release factor N(5)-glutamine methyltransferase [Magnetococcales bacterium]|nr:peptide chain release factor N(5)-glutamine methyltransferase [Magnetococcales bacterium]